MTEKIRQGAEEQDTYSILGLVRLFKSRRFPNQGDGGLGLDAVSLGCDQHLLSFSINRFSRGNIWVPVLKPTSCLNEPQYIPFLGAKSRSFKSESSATA